MKRSGEEAESPRAQKRRRLAERPEKVERRTLHICVVVEASHSSSRLLGEVRPALVDLVGEKLKEYPNKKLALILTCFKDICGVELSLIAFDDYFPVGSFQIKQYSSTHFIETFQRHLQYVISHITSNHGSIIHEGLGAALEQLVSSSSTEKYCILVCGSKPFSYEINLSQLATKKTFEDLPNLFQQNSIMFSAISTSAQPEIKQFVEKCKLTEISEWSEGNVWYSLSGFPNAELQLRKKRFAKPESVTSTGAGTIQGVRRNPGAQLPYRSGTVQVTRNKTPPQTQSSQPRSLKASDTINMRSYSEQGLPSNITVNRRPAESPQPMRNVANQPVVHQQNASSPSYKLLWRLSLLLPTESAQVREIAGNIFIHENKVQDFQGLSGLMGHERLDCKIMDESKLSGIIKERFDNFLLFFRPDEKFKQTHNQLIQKLAPHENYRVFGVFRNTPYGILFRVHGQSLIGTVVQHSNTLSTIQKNVTISRKPNTQFRGNSASGLSNPMRTQQGSVPYMSGNKGMMQQNRAAAGVHGIPARSQAIPVQGKPQGATSLGRPAQQRPTNSTIISRALTSQSIGPNPRVDPRSQYAEPKPRRMTTTPTEHSGGADPGMIVSHGDTPSRMVDPNRISQGVNLSMNANITPNGGPSLAASVVRQHPATESNTRVRNIAMFGHGRRPGNNFSVSQVSSYPRQGNTLGKDQ